MSKFVYQELVVKNIIGLETINQVFALMFERKKPLFLQNLAENSALKRLIHLLSGKQIRSIPVLSQTMFLAPHH